MPIGFKPLPLSAPQTVDSGWLAQLSYPQQTINKTKTAVLAVALAASGAAGPVLTPNIIPGSTYEAPWHQPWSDPTRRKGLNTALEAPASFYVGDLASTTPLESTWHQGWSTPVRSKPGLFAGQQQALALTEAVFGEIILYDKWGYQWSEPSVKSKSGLRTAAQQFLAFQLDAAQQPENVSEAKWHQPWSEPVRFKPRLIAGANPALFQGPSQPVVSFSWAYPWTDPVRQKVGLRASLQQAFTGDTITNITFRNPTWFAPLSLPVRVKPGLRGGNQQYLVQAPTPPIVSFSYFDWLSEPVRLPEGLKAFLQRYYDAPSRLIINPIFATMSATETNNDTLEISILISKRAVRALVSIEEIPNPGNDPVSIRES